MRISNYLPAVAAAALAASGCTATQDVCSQAAEHYASCTGSDSPAALSSCDATQAQLAEQMLGMTCDELLGADVAGKADTGAAILACTVLVAPMLVIHEQGEGEACCVPYNCESNLTCHTDQIIPTCGPKRGEGGGCQSSWQCSGELACVFGRCAPPRELGQPCGEGDCAGDLECVLGTCGPPVEAGAACEDGDCADGLVCSFETCALPGTVGAACEPDECAAGLQCADGTCQEQACDPTALSPCGPDATCWDGMCEPDHAAGEACRSMFDCTFGLFCHDDRKVCYDPFE